MGSFYLLSERENGPGFIAAWPASARILAMGVVVAVILWIVSLTRKLAFHLTSKFAESFPFPDAPRIKLGRLEQIGITLRSAVATPGARWVLVLGLIVSVFMLVPLMIGAGAVLLTIIAGQYGNSPFNSIVISDAPVILVAVTAFGVLPVAACIVGLRYRRRFYKKTGHPLTMEALYLYETGRLSPHDDDLRPDQVITLFGRQWRKPAWSGVLLSVVAIGLVALILGSLMKGLSEMLVLTPEGVRCINDSHRSDEYLIRQCTAALEEVEEPHNRAKLYLHRGVSYRFTGQFELAMADLNEAIKLNPNDGWAYLNRGITFTVTHQFSAAIEDHQKAIALEPDNPVMHNELAWLLATAPDESHRDGNKALEHAMRALELTDEAATRDTLAAALAELGRFEEAVEQQTLAIDMAQSEDATAEIVGIQKRLVLYQNEQPLRCPGEDCD